MKDLLVFVVFVISFLYGVYTREQDLIDEVTETHSVYVNGIHYKLVEEIK